MAFHDDRLPVDIERGAQGGPGFRTTIQALSSGQEKRNIQWSRARGRWNIAYGVQTLEDLSDVVEFFYAREGRGHSFRFKDWVDYRIPFPRPTADTRQSIGATDTSTADFQIFKRYSSGGTNYDRTITKPVSGTVRVWVNSVEISLGAGADQFQVNLLTGVITLGSTHVATNGQAVEVQCEFDVPARFDIDQLDVTAFTFDAGETPAISIKEVLVD